MYLYMFKCVLSRPQNAKCCSVFIVCRHLGENAFPSKEQTENILDALSGTSTDGMTIDDLQERCNLRRGQIENALKFLAAEEVPPIRRVSLHVTCSSEPGSTFNHR